MRHKLKLAVVLMLGISGAAAAQGDTVTPDTSAAAVSISPPGPVSNLRAADAKNDHGHAISLTWDKSPDDGAGRNSVIAYEIFRWFPHQMNEADSLRRELSTAREAIRAFRSDLPRAEHALIELKEDQTRLRTIRFSVARPDDPTFQLTVDFAMRALEDTIAYMIEHGPAFKRSIKPLQRELEQVLDQLPQAHAQYPEGGEWRSLGKAIAGSVSYDNTGSKEATQSDFFPDHTDLYYRVEAVTADETIRSVAVTAGPVQSHGQWFHTGKIPVFGFIMVFFVLTVVFVHFARRGAALYVRPLSGIEAVDDAIGRATEMGRPILYVLGLGTATEVSTIASFSVLGRVAKRVAEYQTPIIVPCYDAIVMAVAQEVVKSSYLDAGRPDDYKEDSVFFVTNYQFAYVAAVNGIMLRERPATNVYMGKFFAESLILAETGTLAGSIQIAGTDETNQIPFFIVSCDFTLIGEELYAASAYLSREPILLGSLKAQDWAKLAVMVIALIGMICTTLGYPEFAQLFHVAG
ncbi:MAG: DUF6754 domain-containing protein [Candidatus Zixiibacteriota bacterium]